MSEHYTVMYEGENIDFEMNVLKYVMTYVYQEVSALMELLSCPKLCRQYKSPPSR